MKLLEFLRGGQGARVVDAVVHHAEVAEGDFWALAEALPPVDLYVPHLEHRSRWRASDPIAVAALVDETSPLAAHLADGSEVPIDRLSTAPTTMPVLLLGPAEATLVRPDAGRSASRPDIIEDQESAAYNQAQCSENCGGGGGGQPPPDVFLQLETLGTFDVVDNGFSWETNEFEFPAYDANGLYQIRVRCEGVPITGVVTVRLSPRCSTTRVHDSAPSEVSRVTVRVIETDGWPNPDDEWWDWITFYPSRDRAIVTNNSSRRRAFLLYGEDASNFGCTPPTPFGNLYCSRVEVQFRW